MARIIVKARYLKQTRKQTPGGYARYVATRDGVSTQTLPFVCVTPPKATEANITNAAVETIRRIITQTSAITCNKV